MKSFRIFAFAAIACLALGGCSFLQGAAVSATSAGPAQAKTIAEAAQAATLVEQGLDLYVKNGHPSPAVLSELKTLATGLHNTLTAANEANRSGNSAAAAAAMSAFNEALAAYHSYATKQGIN